MVLVFLFTNVTICCFDHTQGVHVNCYTLDVMYAGRNYSIDGLLAMCFYCGISFYIFSLFIFTRD